MKKRINTDFYVTLDIRNSIDNELYDFTNVSDLKVISKNVRNKNQIINQSYKIIDGKICFQVAAKENITLGVFDGIVSWDEISELSETGKLHKVVDFPNLYEIVASSNEEDDTSDYVTSAKEQIALLDTTVSDAKIYEVMKEVMEVQNLVYQESRKNGLKEVWLKPIDRNDASTWDYRDTNLYEYDELTGEFIYTVYNTVEGVTTSETKRVGFEEALQIYNNRSVRFY